ncbi:hypothetical protein [Pedobacter sp. Leaf132]|uniref:hypothetical protein n=1 Tax=Pedobacter sp. Leaf132 TaxID=2876557 RepID=UPI001E35C208|nr:hypothetical protein [Pedobacter sp. Leaf132]
MKHLFISGILQLTLAPPTSTTYQLGTKTCTTKFTEKKNAVATLLSLHDNENTAIATYESLATNIRFSLLELQQENQRLFIYQENGKDYIFDPNRIFSDEGIKKTLKPYDANTASKIKDFAAAIFKAFVLKNPNKYLISIHNNTDEGPLSIRDYIKPNKYQNEAKGVFVAPNMDEDDFFLVTEQEDFDYLKMHKQNVVLQSDKPTDDGSLSVYCEKNNIPYINIEAQNEHTKIQKEMMKIIYTLLKTK